MYFPDLTSIETPPAPQPASARAAAAGRSRSTLYPLLLVSGLVAGIGVLGAITTHRSHQAIGRIPAPTRAAIVARLSQDLAQSCGLPEAAWGPLREHCAQQATFVQQFPECDEACVRMARGHAPRATR